MNILDKIIAHKKTEVEVRKKEKSREELEKGLYFTSPVRSLRLSVLDSSKTGIIAEYKRRSPSKGVINNRDSVDTVTGSYTAYGASGISILTDPEFFGGSLDDLLAGRNNDIPILRKDFMIDEYQVWEAKSFGADVILLIAACLSVAQVKQLASSAKSLGLEVLLELHDESDLEHICDSIDLVGVNNRNLRNFEVNLEHSVQLADKIGKGFVKIAESGIHSVNDIQYLREHGFQGFLIGEYFMKQPDPGLAFKNFSDELYQAKRD